MTTTVLEQVRALIADTFGLSIERVTEDASQESLAGWDSLRHLNIILALEQQFQVRLSPADAEQLRSVQAIVEFLERMVDNGE